MRRLSLIFLLFLGYGTYAQKPKAQKTPKFAVDSTDWIAEDLEGSLTFYKNQPSQTELKDKAFADFGIYSAAGKYYIVKDTLTIVHEYDDTTKKHHVERFDFLIRHADKQSLVLAPILKLKKQKLTQADIDSMSYTDYAGRTKNQEPEYYFDNLKYAGDKSFRFTQLSFRPAPGLNVQIDNKGVYYLRGENAADSLHYGSFKAELSSRQLDTLNDLLRRAQIKKMRNWPSGRFAEDAPEYELVVDYNDDKLVVRTDVWPICANDLLVFLEQSYKKVKLVPIKGAKTGKD